MQKTQPSPLLLLKNILIAFQGLKKLNTMVDTQYVPTQVYFKSQDLVHILDNLIITLFKELGYILVQVFIKDPGLIPGQSLSQTLTPTS
jgi:hypothetical protein